MNNEEQEKNAVELKVTIDSLQKEVRSLNDLVLQAKKELHLMDEMKKSAQSILDKERESLNAVLNRIAQEKLEWEQQRTAEESELEGKKEDVAAILARSDGLDKKEADLDAQELDIDEKLRVNREIELSFKSLETHNQSLLREAIEEREKATALIEESDKKIQCFKESIGAVITKTLDEIEEL